jgi:hypothetical protein
MNKQYIYELKINKNDSFKIIDVGVVAKEFELQQFEDGMLCKHKETIGYYVVENTSGKDINITIKTYEDLGEEFNCKLDFKTNTEVYYANQYSNKLIVESIIIDAFNNKGLHKATLKTSIDNPFQYICDDDYDN